MKKIRTSILIIAHNEEIHIDECLASIVNQTKKADEIILIAHNCTDRTVEIASKYREVVMHELKTEEEGPLPAREYGFEKVTGEIIICLDGDSYAESTWLENIIKPFEDKNVVATGGKVYFHSNFRGNIASFFFFLTGYFPIGIFFPFYFWGANFALRKDAYQKVKGFNQAKTIRKKLKLHYSAEDCILSFLLLRVGKLVFSSQAKSYVYPGKFFDGKDRDKKQKQDYQKIRKHFRYIQK